MNLTIWIDLLLIILGISLLLSFIRLYRGPNPPNRTVAFDTIATHAVALLALFAMRNDAPVLIDAAVITAILGFVGTTILARYMERAELRDWEADED
jgi:multisubunit Na+/H+ antiporter MnhF subunit